MHVIVRFLNNFDDHLLCSGSKKVYNYVVPSTTFHENINNSSAGVNLFVTD